MITFSPTFGILNSNRIKSVSNNNTRTCAYSKPAFDTVSFSGAKKAQTKNTLSDNTLKSISIAKKLMKLQRSNRLDYENISAVLNSGSPIPIEIKNLSELPETMRLSSYNAYMQPIYKDDTRIQKAIIYIKTPTNKKEEYEVIASTAHEYTHVLQRSKQDDYMGVAKYSQNLDEARTLNYIGTKAFDKTQKYMLSKLNENTDYMKQFRINLTRGRQFGTKEIENYLPDKAETVSVVDKHIKEAFDELNEIKDPKTLSEEDFKERDYVCSVLRENVLRHFQMEYEATQTSCESLKLSCPNNKGYLLDRNIIAQMYGTAVKNLT